MFVCMQNYLVYVTYSSSRTMSLMIMIRHAFRSDVVLVKLVLLIISSNVQLFSIKYFPMSSSLLLPFYFAHQYIGYQVFHVYCRKNSTTIYLVFCRIHDFMLAMLKTSICFLMCPHVCICYVCLCKPTCALKAYY